jgi:hypothetical protein
MDGTAETLELIVTTLEPTGLTVELSGNPVPPLPFYQLTPIADTPARGLTGELERFTRVQVTAWADTLSDALRHAENARERLFEAGLERLQTTTNLTDQTLDGKPVRGAAADYQFIR